MTNEKRLEYDITGEGRKRLVRAVAEFKETFSEYSGAPTFAYVVDGITIDKEGTLIFPEGTDEEEITELTEYLESRGFPAVGAEQPTETPESGGADETDDRDAVEMDEADTTEETDAEATDDSADDIADPETGPSTIEVPGEGFTEAALENLQKLVDSKASLLKKSLGTDDLAIEVAEDRIRFPWLTDTDSLYVAACTKLVTAICRMAKEAKRVTATEREVESEKYAFRTWLLRLGFIGPEFKNDRAILMKNLSGTAAFKNAEDAQAFADRQKEKRDAAKAAVQEAETAEKTNTEEEGAE